MNHGLSPHVRRLHRLAWQPGAWFDRSWWTHLRLAEWQALYDRHPSCRSAIDATLVARRGFPRQPLPAVLSARQIALLELEPRLHALTTALGLIALDCPDYLLLRDSRQALSAHLGQRACEQLFILHTGWHAQPAMHDFAQLSDVALQTGTRWLSTTAGDCAASHGLLGLLPHCGDGEYDPPVDVAASAQEWLIKLGRFL